MSQVSSTVEFAPWASSIVDNDVEIVSLRFDAVGRQLDVTLQAGGSSIAVTFVEVEAFRLLDEGGLTQLWAASSAQARPGKTTFRVRGHKWTAESEIVFHLGTTEGWSYVIATVEDCLEVLTRHEPAIVPH